MPRGRWEDLLAEVPPGGNYLHFTERHDYEPAIFRNRGRYWSFLLKLDPDQPAPTLPAQRVTFNGPFHWANRHLRVREMARLQSMPDWMPLDERSVKARRHIGNAVPVALGAAVLWALRRQLGSASRRTEASDAGGARGRDVELPRRDGRNSYAEAAINLEPSPGDDMTDVLAETQVEEIPYDKLRLDPENPRLLKFTLQEGPLDEDAMVSALLSRFDPEPIGRSIVEYGFFTTEPLIVFPDGDAFIVAEGNRRLVALKLLREAEQREAVEADEVWDDSPSSWRQTRNAWSAWSHIPCQNVPDRQAAAPIIGYRHIVGVLKWDAFEKAAYVVNLLRGRPSAELRGGAELSGVTPTADQALRARLARDRAGPVRRHRRATGPRASSAVGSERLGPGVREYIDAVSPTTMEPDSEKAYEADDEQMGKLISFLYGEPGGPDRLFSDTRRIDDFSTALQSEDGRRIFDQERDLESAFEVAGGRRDYVLKTLGKALTNLQQVEVTTATTPRTRM